MNTRQALRELDAQPSPEPDPVAVALNNIEPGLFEYYAMLETECQQLGTERAALTGFVAADDALDACQEAALTVEDIGECARMLERKTELRQRLATDHGLPLITKVGL